MSKEAYKGKKISIFGDSISTLQGYNPQGYKLYYHEERYEKFGVRNPEDTWWGKVIAHFGGELLVNNSWSGSRVALDPDSEGIFPSGISDERTFGLHKNETNPDVIIVYLGTNDWLKGTPVLEFKKAYKLMLSKLRANYPECEIWCCTLNKTFVSKDPNFVFEVFYKSWVQHEMEEYNQYIRQYAAEYNCRLVETYKQKVPYDTREGLHPNKEGMQTIGELVIRGVEQG